MKKYLLRVVAAILVTQNSFAYTIYTCSTNSGKVEVSADGKSITLLMPPKEIAFKAVAKLTKDGLLVWKNAEHKVALQIQRAGPYDGLQDPLWGELKYGQKKYSLTCFLTEVSNN